MQVFRYKSSGGKDLIIDFIESLSMIEKAEGYYLLEHLESIVTWKSVFLKLERYIIRFGK